MTASIGQSHKSDDPRDSPGDLICSIDREVARYRPRHSRPVGPLAPHDLLHPPQPLLDMPEFLGDPPIHDSSSESRRMQSRSSLLQGAPQLRRFNRGELPDQFWLCSVVMVSENDSKSGDAHPVNRRILGLECCRTVRRRLTEDFQKSLSGTQQDLFTHCAASLHHLLECRTRVEDIEPA